MSTPNSNSITYLPNNNIEIELLYQYGDQTQPQFRYIVNIRDILNVWQDNYNDTCEIAIRASSLKTSAFDNTGDNDDYMRLLNGTYQDLGDDNMEHPIFQIRFQTYLHLKKLCLSPTVKLKNNTRILQTNDVENTEIGNIMS